MASRKAPVGHSLTRGFKGLREARVLPLRQLRPPGALYRTWFFLPAGMNPDVPESWGVFGLAGADRPAAVLRLHQLSPFYGGEIPEAAIALDDYVDASTVPVRHRGNRVVQTPLKNFVASLEGRAPARQDPGPSRDVVHRLHAKATFALGDDKAARITVDRPCMPSDAWRFRDGGETGARQVHRAGQQATPETEGRLGRLRIPTSLPTELRKLLVALGDEYRRAAAATEDLETTVARDQRKSEALARWAALSTDDRITAAARNAEVAAEDSLRRLAKARQRADANSPVPTRS